MQSATELKHIFQDGWNIPERVENYVRTVVEGEFQDRASLGAWRECLEVALAAKGRLKILDVGTGPGVFACLYSQMGHECIGLDFSKRMLNEACRRATELMLDCSFAFGDAESPPFEPQSFDVVSSRHLLFNLPQPDLAIRRWVQLLKPNGRMILIGDEIQETPGRSPAGRPPEDHRPGWRPTAEYLKAVSQCPLFRHTTGAIQTLMELAGLQNVQACATDAIYAARREARASANKHLMSAGKPYLLVGTQGADD